MRRQALALDARGFAPVDGLRAAIAVVLALSLGIWLRDSPTGVVAAAGAINAGIVSLLPALPRPLRSMSIAVVGLTLATLLGLMTASMPVLSLATLGLLAFVGGVLASAGPVGTTVMVQSLVGFVVFGRFLVSPSNAVGLALVVFAGGCVQILLTALFALRHQRPSSAVPSPPAPTLSKTVTMVMHGLHTCSSEAWWHSARLTSALVVAEVLARWFNAYRGYWIPLTVVVVLRPDWMATSQRVVARWFGTLLGVLIAGIVLAIVQPHGITIVAVTGVIAWAAFTTFQASYALFSGFVAALVVLLLEFVLVSPVEAAVERGLATVNGGLIALLAFWIVRPQVWDRLRFVLAKNGPSAS